MYTVSKMSPPRRFLFCLVKSLEELEYAFASNNPKQAYIIQTLNQFQDSSV